MSNLQLLRNAQGFYELPADADEHLKSEALTHHEFVVSMVSIVNGLLGEVQQSMATLPTMQMIEKALQKAVDEVVSTRLAEDVSIVKGMALGRQQLLDEQLVVREHGDNLLTTSTIYSTVEAVADVTTTTIQERIDAYDAAHPNMSLRKAEKELGISRETIRKRRAEREQLTTE